MSSKTASPEKFTKKQQEQLDAIAEKVIDLEEQIELAEDEKSTEVQLGEKSTEAPSGYTPEPGTEHLVHLKIIRGHRYDENTGKELSTPYVQTFSYAEYQNFMKKASLIGYTVVEELYNPYKK